MKRDEIQLQAINSLKVGTYIDVAPRVGKTKIYIEYFKKHNYQNILVSVPRDSIKESWSKELTIWNCDKNVTVICKASLHKEDLSSYDLICIDEIHELSEWNIATLRKYLGPMIGGSGSISKDTKTNLFLQFQMRCCFTYSIEQAIEDNIISNYQINIVELPLDNKEKTILSGPKTKQFYTTEQDNYSYLSKEFDRWKVMSWSNPGLNNVKMMWAGKRSRALYSYPSKVHLAKTIIDSLDRVLIFTSLTDIADQLSEYTYHSKTVSDDNNLTSFQDSKINSLACCKQLDMGITILDLKHSVFHQIQSKEESAIQKVLRIMNYEDDKNAEIWITCYTNTQDEQWCMRALKGFNSNKIKYLNYKEILK